MSMGNIEAGFPANVTTSGNIKSSFGTLLGFYVNSTSAGTLILYDDAATGTTTPISGTITPAIGFQRFPASFAKGLNAVIGGTLNVTFFYA